MKEINETIFCVATRYDAEGNPIGERVNFSNHPAAKAFAKDKGFTMSMSKREADVEKKQISYIIYDTAEEAESESINREFGAILKKLSAKEVDTLHKYMDSKFKE